MADGDPKIVKLHFVEQAVKGAEDAPQERPGGAGGGGSSSLERTVEFSDDALALEFTNRHDGDYLYVAKLGTWFIWDGQRWKPDETDLVLDQARKTCRTASVRKDSKAVASNKTIAAVTRLASADERVYS